MSLLIKSDVSSKSLIFSYMIIILFFWIKDRHTLYPNIPLVVQEQVPVKYQPGPEVTYEKYLSEGHTYQPLTCQQQSKLSKKQGTIVYPFNSALLSHHPTTIHWYIIEFTSFIKNSIFNYWFSSISPQCQEKVITR